jgi:DNA primase large subunit
MKVKDVIALFRTAPDFEEHTTRYQVEYIAKKGYRVPSCVNVESYGLCVNVCRVRNPINYGKRKIAQRQAKGAGSG